jgi:iron complex outermembrane receptor protein
VVISSPLYTMKKYDVSRRSLCGLLSFLLSYVFALGVAYGTEVSSDLSEAEFLTDIPMVYSASRLPQQPQDSAGAITVLDRDFIRSSGARDLTDVFRLVPGFQVGTAAGGRSVVAYHGLSGQISQRMQVFVDGRSLYAPYLFGGIDWSAIGVPLDEIERIEIQRGSNSVTYGANAFLGVIHIITRAASQSSGWTAQMTQGNNGISDRYVRWGSALPSAQWRLVIGSKGEDGLHGREDPYHQEYLDVRSEFQITPHQEFSVHAGITRNRYGTGFEGRVSDPVRSESLESAFLRTRFRHTLSPAQEFSIAFSRTEDAGGDSFDVPLLGTEILRIDSNRQASRDTLEYQHYNDFGRGLRASWGIEYQHVRVASQQLFNTKKPQTNEAWRAYVNQEWKPSAHWTANVGGLWEQDQLAPAQFAPRLGLNWKPTNNQVFKLGFSSAFRAPSLFEQRSNWRIEAGGQVLDVRYLSTGGLIPERVRAWDLVYAGQHAGSGLSLDLRAFHEEITQLITGELYLLPPDQAYIPNAVAYDLRNNAEATSTGVEYQLAWRPLPQSVILVSQYFARPQASKASVLASIPEQSTSVMASHTWANGWTTGLTYSQLRSIAWLGEATTPGEQRLITLRLARAMRIGATAAQFSAVVRQPMGDFEEFRELQRNAKQFWISLRFEY